MALCLLVCLLPLSAMAAGPIRIQIHQNDHAFKADWYMMPGDVHYITSDENKDISLWEKTDAPTDNFAKFEMNAEGNHLDITIKNFHAEDTIMGNWSGATFRLTEGDYSVTMTVLGENSFSTIHPACIENSSTGDFIITGGGTLSVETKGESPGGIFNYGSNLIMKDITFIGLQTMQETMSHHVISMSKGGNLTLENVKATFNTNTGSPVFFSQPKGNDTAGHSNPDMDESRTLTIKNCEISVNQLKGNAFGTFACRKTIIDDQTTLEIFAPNGQPFSVAPTIEGEYTAIGGTKPENAKAYNPRKNFSYVFKAK